jgi:hypothetical protein
MIYALVDYIAGLMKCLPGSMLPDFGDRLSFHIVESELGVLVDGEVDEINLTLRGYREELLQLGHFPRYMILGGVGLFIYFAGFRTMLRSLAGRD